MSSIGQRVCLLFRLPLDKFTLQKPTDEARKYHALSSEMSPRSIKLNLHSLRDFTMGEDADEATRVMQIAD